MPGIQKAALTPVDQAIDRLRRTSRAGELLLSNPPASTSVALRGGVRVLDLPDVRRRALVRTAEAEHLPRNVLIQFGGSCRYS